MIIGNRDLNTVREALQNTRPQPASTPFQVSGLTASVGADSRRNALQVALEVFKRLLGPQAAQNPYGGGVYGGGNAGRPSVSLPSGGGNAGRPSVSLPSGGGHAGRPSAPLAYGGIHGGGGTGVPTANGGALISGIGAYGGITTSPTQAIQMVKDMTMGRPAAGEQESLRNGLFSMDLNVTKFLHQNDVIFTTTGSQLDTNVTDQESSMRLIRAAQTMDDAERFGFETYYAPSNNAVAIDSDSLQQSGGARRTVQRASGFAVNHLLTLQDNSRALEMQKLFTDARAGGLLTSESSGRSAAAFYAESFELFHSNHNFLKEHNPPLYERLMKDMAIIRSQV